MTAAHWSQWGKPHKTYNLVRMCHSPPTNLLKLAKGGYMKIYCTGCQKDVNARLTNGKERYPHRPDLHDIIHIGYVQGFNQIAHEARFAPYNHIEPIPIEKAKQAITSLIKELVAEAKPEKHIHHHAYGKPFEDAQDIAYNAATDEFEQNLLKALEV